jgi:hypothetical protein
LHALSHNFVFGAHDQVIFAGGVNQVLEGRVQKDVWTGRFRIVDELNAAGVSGFSIYRIPSFFVLAGVI